MPTTTGLTIPFTGLRKQYNALRSEILDATDAVLRSGVIMNGNHTAEFEHWLARKNRSKFAVTCHSGTQALEIIASYYAEKVTLHPRVIMPTMTYAATANAFMRAGWDVVLVDTDAYGILDDTRIPIEIDSYEAVVLIGLYGRSMTHSMGVRSWTGWMLNNVVVLEDAAQHWLSAESQRVGRATAVSFDPMKNLNAYGNGGAVVTDDLELAEFARSWRDNGKPNHAATGTNSRISEIDSATLMIKTRYVDQWQKRRQQIADYWCDAFDKTKIRCLIDHTNSHNHAFHKFVIDIDNRDNIQSQLAQRKIETRVHYAHPLHELQAYRHCIGPGLLSVSSSLCRRVLSLPIYPELTDLEVEYVSDQVLDLV